MKAIVIEGRGHAVIQRNAPEPSLRSGGYILVKTLAVAVNPSDWKHVDFVLVGNPTGTRLGLDYAGVVMEVGEDVPTTADNGDRLRPGDRVFGICHGANVRYPEDGAFAEYLVAKACFAIRIPEGVSFSEAAAMGTGLAAVAQGLFQDLKLQLPGVLATTVQPQTPRRSWPILIYGGSTASGVMGLQFARLSGCTPIITTCSPQNFDYLKQLGADFCFDYHDPDCGNKIRELTNGRLRHAWDCITTLESAQTCARALSPKLCSHYSSLLFISSACIKRINPKVKCSTTIGYTILGEEFEKETVVRERPEDFEFGKAFWKIAESLLQDGMQFRPVRQIVNEGGSGLEGVLCGLDYLKRGKVSAAKLVYTMSK
ncbi:zinc-binding oxidoreductase [Colletotrichum incanum]|uniref:Zinc-binding oxidoreductase n=1 Tax=Colletotrichum incanum TaxID=1573173 RepID=A0A167BCT4_COLIC|nr:zinc-binding oxidoreductase [Colletotrichum incanum]